MNEDEMRSIVDSVAETLKSRLRAIYGADSAPSLDDVMESLLRMAAQEVALKPVADRLRDELSASSFGGGAATS